MKSMDTVIRMIRTIHMLQSSPRGLTVTELADKLAERGFRVSKRTLERNLHDLSRAFPISVEDDRRPYLWRMLPC